MWAGSVFQLSDSVASMSQPSASSGVVTPVSSAWRMKTPSPQAGSISRGRGGRSPSRRSMKNTRRAMSPEVKYWPRRRRRARTRSFPIGVFIERKSENTDGGPKRPGHSAGRHPTRCVLESQTSGLAAWRAERTCKKRPKLVIYCRQIIACRRGSTVERSFRKAQVVGSIPTVGSR